MLTDVRQLGLQLSTYRQGGEEGGGTGGGWEGVGAFVGGWGGVGWGICMCVGGVGVWV